MAALKTWRHDLNLETAMDDDWMSKKDMTEEDIKLRFITPAINKAHWSLSDITMETQVKFTDGKICL